MTTQPTPTAVQAAVERLRGSIGNYLYASVPVGALKTILAELSRLERQVITLRGSEEEGPYTCCTTCSRSMVWQRDKGYQGVWMCPNCTYRRAQELTEALKPFAQVMEKYKDWPEHSFNTFAADMPLWIVHGTPQKFEFTIGDLRNAAAALKAASNG